MSRIDNNIFDLVRKKGFYPYRYMSDSEKFKEELPSKENLTVPCPTGKLVTKNMIML